ncbi:MAG: protein translocase subunit SecF [Endozoicomonadaceae bacterium]|nr:protein translocase subunit SecF [Endozoicomonadaceae bacterium]
MFDAAGKPERKVIGFMRLGTFATVLSILLVVGSLVSLGVNGINWGLDFTGGTLVELSYDKPADVSNIRDQLEQMGYSDTVVQEFGSEQEVLIRISGDEATLGQRVSSSLAKQYDGKVIVRRVEFVGPQVGDRLREQGGLGLLMAMGLVMAYVAFRFQFKFSIGAVISLAHDAIVVLGVFSVFQLQFDLTVMAALLAVIGYSLNDTIIVYDRVRENFRKMRKGTAIDIINISLTQTLGRTLATSGTTIMVLLSLLFFGGDMIHNFSLALLVGIVIGTSSSIYVACNVLLYMNVSREDLIISQANDEMP